MKEVPTNEQLERASPFLFIQLNQIKNERGLPLEWRDHAFLVDILEDMSPLQVWLKAPQIGATVIELIKSFWVGKMKGKDIIYTLPTQGDVNDMAGGKINRILAQNPKLLEWTKDKDTVEQKAVGDNIIYYRGTFTTKAAMMVSSQLNIHDEVDASNPEVITQYETRLQANTQGWRWYFSHPSIVGAGVDIYWQQSSQREWFIHCNNCDEWGFLEWPESVDQEKQEYCCKFCGNTITDDQRRRGEWRKKYPDAEFSGWHVSQLMCPWIPATKIIKDFKEKEPQYFHNYVLGLPYADNKSKVTLETIKELLTPNTVRKGRVIFGVDTGIKIRWMCGDENGLFGIGECDSYQELQREVDRYNDWVMVIDKGGDIIGVEQFSLDNKGKVFLCYFQQDKQSLDLIKWHTDDNYGLVSMDRNRLIQLVVDEMNDKRYNLDGDLNKWWPLWTHWQFMYRIIGEDKRGNLTYIWECNKSSHRNDFALAMCYWRVGKDRFEQNQSSFEGKVINADLTIPEAPYRELDGTMGRLKLTMPEVPSRSEDWRYS